MSPVIAALYTLCILFLSGFGIFVIAKDARSALNRQFAFLSLALLGWVGTLFAFNLQTSPLELLWIGRLNFASGALAGTLSFSFVRRVIGLPLPYAKWIWGETAVLALLSLLTGSVDRAELVVLGTHITEYGPLFPLYAIHLIMFLFAALYSAFRPRSRTRQETKNQLSLIGGGGLATAAIAILTEIILPYGFRDFQFIHLGTVSTSLFLLAVGYAVFVHHLFDVHVIIRATFVYAGLVAIMLELYQASVAFLAHLLPFGDAGERSYAATAIALIVNAFTHEPIRRWLEKVAHKLFHARH